MKLQLFIVDVPSITTDEEAAVNLSPDTEAVFTLPTPRLPDWFVY